MLKSHLKPDGFAPEEVARQIHIEISTGQNRQNRRTRTARTNAEYFYWLNWHFLRRRNRAERVWRELQAKTLRDSDRLTYSEIAERARDHGATFHASWEIANWVCSELEATSC